MTTISRRLAAAAGAAGLGFAAVVATGSAAFAASPGASVPYTDPQVAGGLVLENAAGQPVTSGNIQDKPTFAKAVASGPAAAGFNLTNLNVATPQNGKTPQQWPADSLSYDPSSFDPATQNPTYTATNNDPTLEQYIDEGGTENTATDSYAGLYQLRLLSTANGQPQSNTYFQAVIKVTETGKVNGKTTGTWQLVEPAVTTTSLAVSGNGSPYTLTAGVSAPGYDNPAGTVTFRDNGAVVGTAPVNTTTGQATTTYASTAGSKDVFTAIFTPTAPTQYDASVSPAITPVTVGAALPEAPYAILLPLLGAGVGGALYAARRRRVNA